MSQVFVHEYLSRTFFSPHPELTNGTEVKRSFTDEANPTSPGKVGILPLDHFIYIIIGVLVFLTISFWLWKIAKILRSPKSYFNKPTSESIRTKLAAFREKRPPAPGRVGTIVRGEVRRLRTEHNYKGDGVLDPAFMATPNLPIPVVKATQASEKSYGGIDTGDIEAWGVLVKEKESLSIKIANLERLDQARKQAGEMGVTNPRLVETLQRRSDVENSINAIYEGFKQRRGEWSAEEWRLVELIMQLSPN